ncbi:MAG TPA: rod shape-determining protein MreD [Bacteroidales bacterium]|jgi:rod shape-determining protein MreD|nr:rod shape-determining protein MreD [Bacteroidales bacterium]MDI9574548.1 rod shape-determining protein MreD [Bacteroidota bacterium]OQC59655.1 MAG: hypothetical protein BWX51_01417 [Bacteroidetes bacterium ADurb.Bin012]MBP9512550.1 rod shape-determining protein MreD [Bacteroidales bacterium]MBP9589173.1 rod shape-determining protein MreD [Bacteroidales bacterium]
MKTYIKHILRFLVLVFIQLAIFDHLNFGFYIHPLIYILFLLKLPLNTPRWLLLVLAFVLGTTLDIFQSSPGINAAASVLVAFIRPFSIDLIFPRREFDENTEPSIDDFGFQRFFVFTLILTFVLHFILFFLEVFCFDELGKILVRSLASAFVTTLLIVLVELLFFRKKS